MKHLVNSGNWDPTKAWCAPWGHSSPVSPDAPGMMVFLPCLLHSMLQEKSAGAMVGTCMFYLWWPKPSTCADEFAELQSVFLKDIGFSGMPWVVQSSSQSLSHHFLDPDHECFPQRHINCPLIRPDCLRKWKILKILFERNRTLYIS